MKLWQHGKYPHRRGERVPASAIERAFERKVRLSKWALLFEQLWPRAWLVLGLAGLFIGASLAGLWPRLPELPHKIVLGLFGLAFAGALVALARVRWPSREQAIRRVEAISGHQAPPGLLLRGHAHARRRGCPHRGAVARAPRSGSPHCCRSCASALPRRAPTATTPSRCARLLLLGVFVLLVAVGDSASDRLRSAFRFGALAKGAEARIDAWVTPPAYTGRPPVMLADGSHGLARPQDKPAGPYEIPDRSLLVVRGTGAAVGALSLEVPGSNGAAERMEAPAPANATDVSELKLEVRKSGTVTVTPAASRC